MIYLGIDPGKSGAAVALYPYDVEYIKLAETEADVSAWFAKFEGVDCFAYLERVSAMPRQGVASTFKFGTSFGFLRGMLFAHGIPFEMVTPGKWQRHLGCLSKGDKNVTKSKAQELWPGIKVTHAIADALLISEYCRRVRNNLAELPAKA